MLEGDRHSPDHLTWSVAWSPVAYPDPHIEPYLPILLLGFDEDEYFNRPAEGDDNTQAGVT